MVALAAVKPAASGLAAVRHQSAGNPASKATLGSNVPASWSRSFGDGSPDSAGNQSRGIGQNAGGRKTAGTGQITRLPVG